MCLLRLPFSLKTLEHSEHAKLCGRFRAGFTTEDAVELHAGPSGRREDVAEALDELLSNVPAEVMDDDERDE